MPSKRIWTARLAAILISVVAICALAVAIFAAPQQITVLDFTNVQPRGRKRPPRPASPGPQKMPAVCPTRPNEAAPGGRCGGFILGQQLRLSLVSLDKKEYALGDEVLYDIRVENTGGSSFTIPSRASLADIEPEDETLSYEYVPLEIWLRLTDSRQRGLNTKMLVLYGTKATPGTEIELKKGEWIDLRGKATLRPSDDSHLGLVKQTNMPLPAAKVADVQVGAFYYRSDVYRYDASTRRETWGCQENEISYPGPGLLVTFLPRSDR
jgi:hypothetical protein